MAFVVDRDATDHVRFSPLQTTFAQTVCRQYGMPADLTTGILIEPMPPPNDNDNKDSPTARMCTAAHRDSTAILRMLLVLQPFYYRWIGWLALTLVPKVVRDACYQAFARNRGTIWKAVKRVTGMGDTQLDAYRTQILGIADIDQIAVQEPGWGFTPQKDATTIDHDTTNNNNKESIKVDAKDTKQD